MSNLTDEEYGEYVRLLSDWVEANKEVRRLRPSSERGARADDGPDGVAHEASERLRRVQEAVYRFRLEHGLPQWEGWERSPVT